MKRIILCLDGTWNSASFRKPPTNVVRIRNALVAGNAGPDVSQRVYYDEGVGSDDADPIDSWLGGAFGLGIGQNVRQAYKYLSKHYEHGDEIYLIGFSRGAHTARSVAGMIGACGLLRPEECSAEAEARAWAFYRLAKKDRAPGDERAMRRRCFSGVRVKCVAVFDTVGALGIPDNALNWIGKSKFAFHDTRLGPVVENALHAVAIDEHRGTFKATMWERPFNEAGEDCPKVQQVWFAGAHSDVGGGYSDHGELGQITLYWMIRRLLALGVRFDRAKLKELAREIRKDLIPASEVHDSWNFRYQWLDRFRPHYRPIAGESVKGSERGTPQLEYEPIEEFVHSSALERCLAKADYRPRNLRRVASGIARGAIPVIDRRGRPMTAEAVVARYGAALRGLGVNPG